MTTTREKVLAAADRAEVRHQDGRRLRDDEAFIDAARILIDEAGEIIRQRNSVTYEEAVRSIELHEARPSLVLTMIRVARAAANGVTVTTHHRDGRVTSCPGMARQRAASPVIRLVSHPLARRRGAGRPRARRVSRSSAASGDSGSGEPGEPEPPSPDSGEGG